MSEGILPRFGTALGQTADDQSRAETPPAVDIAPRAEEAVALLKALGHEGRLMILCHLVTGEKSVAELETLLSSRQAAVSQQLARLRLEGLVQARREGQQIYYSILDPRAVEVVGLLNRLFCEDDAH